MTVQNNRIDLIFSHESNQISILRLNLYTNREGGGSLKTCKTHVNPEKAKRDKYVHRIMIWAL